MISRYFFGFENCLLDVYLIEFFMFELREGFLIGLILQQHIFKPMGGAHIQPTLLARVANKETEIFVF